MYVRAQMLNALVRLSRRDNICLYGSVWPPQLFYGQEIDNEERGAETKGGTHRK